MDKLTWTAIETTDKALTSGLEALAEANAVASAIRKDVDKLALNLLAKAGVKAPKGSEIVLSHRFGFAYAVAPAKARKAKAGGIAI